MIYLDNASTTKIYPEVLEKIIICIEEYGNPSSNHKMGRKAKVAIENARKNIAEILNITPSEVFFTSSGSESNNNILYHAAESLKIKNFISSKIEHDSVYETMIFLKKKHGINIHYIDILEKGEICLKSLEKILAKNTNSFVSLMHINNESGNISDIEKIGDLCKFYKSYFHSDCVQSVGKEKLNLSKINVDYISASAHKFHGPKGVGIMMAKNSNISPMICGGAQEKNIRAGTENVAGIIGCEEALKISVQNLEKDTFKVQKLKSKIIENIYSTEKFILNDSSLKSTNYSPYILNIGIKSKNEDNLIIYLLDNKNICASSSSACSSGVEKKSRVAENIYKNKNINPLRISLCRYNTEEEINYFCKTLLEVVKSL